MRRIAIYVMMGIFVAVLFCLNGCGGDGGGGAFLITSNPTISNLQYSPTSAILNQGGGSITINGTYDFIDFGGDLAGGTVTIKAFDLNNVQTVNTTTPITGNVAGLTSGTITSSATADTTVAGTFNYILYITDANGNKSNELTGTFTVRTSNPIISNLQYSPTSATLNQGGGSITINGTYDFIDFGGDLAGGTVTIMAFDLNNVQTVNTTTPITGNVAGLTSGTITSSATADTTVAGTFHYIVYITDGNGNKSNELTGTFTVQ